MAAALPTRIFIGNGARFVIAEKVAPRYSDRISSSSSRIRTAFAVGIQRYRIRGEQVHHDVARRACIVLTVSVAQLQLGIKPVHQNDPNQNTPGQNKLAA